MNQPTLPTDTMAAMTIREYYAGLAMQGLIAQNMWYKEDAVKMAVEYADALIKQLNQQ